MHSLLPFTVLLYTSAATAIAWGPWAPKDNCLSDAEALSIAAKWLHIWDTNAITSLSDLTSIVTPNVTSVDWTYPPPTYGVQELFDTITAPGNYSTTDVKQTPLFAFHSCDTIATRWIETAYSTGYNS